MRRMLVDPKGLGKPPMSSGREENVYVWTKKVENYVSGVFPNVRGALTSTPTCRVVLPDVQLSPTASTHDKLQFYSHGWSSSCAARFDP